MVLSVFFFPDLCGFVRVLPSSVLWFYPSFFKFLNSMLLSVFFVPNCYVFSVFFLLQYYGVILPFLLPQFYVFISLLPSSILCFFLSFFLRQFYGFIIPSSFWNSMFFFYYFFNSQLCGCNLYSFFLNCMVLSFFLLSSILRFCLRQPYSPHSCQRVPLCSIKIFLWYGFAIVCRLYN